MADIHSPEIRSYNMSCIHNRGTKPELIVRKFLFTKGFRYRLNYKRLPGKPDIILPKYKTVIFVHGCFWHGHENCKYFKIPKTRTDWWINKISENQSNDNKAINLLSKDGWKIIVIWECKLKRPEIENTLNNLYNTLLQNK